MVLLKNFKIKNLQGEENARICFELMKKLYQE
jgi:hypothetical protein